MTLLYIYILWVAACVDSISADSHITVSARVGSTVVLPCNLRNVFTKTPRVRWHNDVGFVFERSSGGTQIDPGYEGRVDIPENELRKGNCSLVLKNVRITDDGAYRSFVVEYVDRTNTDKMQDISRVKLSVDAFQISAQVGSTVLLPCEWSDLPIQTPHVEWYIDSETVFERKGKESFQGEGYEGRVDVPEDELLKGICSLVLKNVSATDAAVYRSSMVVTHTKKSVLVQKVELSVYENPEKREEEPSGEAGINWPHLLIFILSLFMCFLFSR
ncbi:butyrophilin subfamily 1 member A1-like [Pangasianodon hypophthalmus]|uniref:butyrophilin subfamily 1 member A1-like n=1 Tax=Pangasianodon hypophthalmus TaxID=310915 RepID=UPI0023080CAB|nr:butyrophilin subfamily 1 member A1-like [Pangasianodon hypophthalmus]